MAPKRMFNDAVRWFMEELTSAIVAKSGRPSDRYHIGKIILESLKRYPEKILQIDGATDESETNASVLERSTRCASVMRDLGLQQGDVVVLMAPNHVDVCIPLYASLYLGLIVAAVDKTLGINELQETFKVSKPKVVFCQSDKAPEVQVALNEIDLDAQIVTFDKGDYLCSFSEFLGEYGGATSSEEFEPSDFDAEETIGFLVTTSGTTGLPKGAAVTHKNFAITLPILWVRYRQFPGPTKLAMVGSPLQWLTALIHFILSPIMVYTRLQTSLPFSQEHCYELINKYRPTWTLFSPTMMTAMIKGLNGYNCDFTCFESIILAGSAVSENLLYEIKQMVPNTEVFNVYGMSELTGIAFLTDDPPPGSCGKPLACWEYRLIDNAGEDILEPNIPGELLMRGPGIFKEYYSNPEATKETFAEDRWFKTGDLFYRDEHYYYYFVERLKLLLKYKSYQISPVEVENVIRTHPAVSDVAVTGIADPECGDLPVACVVPIQGHDIDAEEIKQIVKETLSDSKQLRGGVIFMTELPLTPSTKVNRKKLKEMVLHMERQ